MTRREKNDKDMTALEMAFARNVDAMKRGDSGAHFDATASLTEDYLMGGQYIMLTISK